MTLVDANILLYAVDSKSPFHERASDWLAGQLRGSGRVGLPWLSLWAFLRIITNHRAVETPLSAQRAWSYVEEWLAAAATWVPGPTERHAAVLGGLITRYQLSGDMIPDAQLAAIGLEHGLIVCSADTDFARFTEIRWENPLRPSR